MNMRASELILQLSGVEWSTRLTGEFLSADIVLVTVPAKTGPRSRIINAFSFGACVVAHCNNQIGLPELSHGDNILLGASGAEIAELVCLAAGNPDLRKRLGKAGRHTYEKSFSYNMIMPKYVSFLKGFTKLWIDYQFLNHNIVASKREHRE